MGVLTVDQEEKMGAGHIIREGGRVVGSLTVLRKDPLLPVESLIAALKGESPELPRNVELHFRGENGPFELCARRKGPGIVQSGSIAINGDITPAHIIEALRRVKFTGRRLDAGHTQVARPQ